MIRHNDKTPIIQIDPAYKTTSRIMSGEMFYGDGKVIVKPKGHIAILEINYTGTITIDPLLDTEYYFKKSNRRVLILNTSLNTREGVWFEYEGKFNVMTCRATDWYGKTIIFQVKNNNINIWNQFRTTFGTAEYWTDYGGEINGTN